MRDLKQYWREVREVERNLPPFVCLMSLTDPQRGLVGGVLSEVPAAAAAKLLHAQSHRPATAEEIAAHLEHRSTAVRREFHEGLRRQGITIVPVPEGVVPAGGGKHDAGIDRRSPDFPESKSRQHVNRRIKGKPESAWRT